MVSIDRQGKKARIGNEKSTPTHHSEGHNSYPTLLRSGGSNAIPTARVLLLGHGFYSDVDYLFSVLILKSL